MEKTRRFKLAVAGAVAVATLLVYLAALRNDFVDWDDSAYILDNVHIRSLNGAFLKWAFTDFYASNWHPLTWLSHALDYALWGLNPLGHHLTSIILHAINAFLVVILVIRLLEAFKERPALTGQSSFLNDRAVLTAAGTTGLLFGLHPVHVESVAWVAERKDLLCGLFFLLSMITYLKYAEEAGKETSDKSKAATVFNKQYFFSIGFFVAALLSKPMAVTLPIVLLILDWHPFSRIRSFKTMRRPILEKIPFFALSLTCSITTIIAQQAARSIAPLAAQPLPARFQVAVTSLIAYLGKMLLPFNLVPFYPYPHAGELSLTNGEFLFSVAAFSAVTIACIILMKKQQLWLSAWLFYVVTLMPVLGIIQAGDQAMADRYTYVPSLGLFLVIGVSAAWGATQLSRSARRGSRLSVFGAGLAIAVLLSLSYLTVRQINVWENSVRLWSYVIEKEPERVPFAYMNRGAAYQVLGKFDEALADYNATLLLDPSDREVYNNRGLLFKQMGYPDKAIADYTMSIMLNGSNAFVYNNRASVYGQIGQLDKALADCNAAIQLNATYPAAYLTRGRIFEKAGEFDRALTDYNRAIAMDPNDIDAYNDRGILYALFGQYDRALEDYGRALALNPAFAEAYFNRGGLYSKAGQTELARADYQKACDLGYEQGCNALQ